MNIISISIIFVVQILLVCTLSCSAENIVMENPHFRYEIDSRAGNAAFIDKHTGHNWCVGGAAAFVQLKKEDPAVHRATSAVLEDDVITYTFGSTEISAGVSVEKFDNYISFKLTSLTGPPVYKIGFVNVAFTLDGKVTDPFAACGLACNVHTKVEEIPGHTRGILASAFPHIGWKDAEVAVVGSRTVGYRELLKEVVATCGMEHTKIGGPWALDAEINRGSYIIDHGGAVGEANIDGWIELAHALGAKQIDMHAGKSMRFGDYMPNSENYPNGMDGLKAVIEKMRKKGVSAGLHTYAQFIAKDSPWVTPIPDPRLAKLRTFTLSAEISSDATEIPLNESTAELSTLTGFFVLNSLAMQIGEELITFSGYTKEPPYKLTGCERGAFGTKAADHSQSTKVEQLKEFFFLFVPDSKTDLIEEVARRTAEVYNYCGFDMIYLDALDGSWTCGKDMEDHWHTGARFVWELNRHLDKPAIMEMSTFHHHLWGVRSRIGAWDCPLKGYKTFNQRHVESNRSAADYMLPTNLGWWSAHPVHIGDGILPERIFMDDLEFLCAKALAYDSSLSYLLGFSPELYEEYYNTRRIVAMIRQYEELRLSRYFSSEILEKLKEPGEFKLEGSAADGWRMRPVEYAKHVGAVKDDWSADWEVNNSFEDQPVKLRIEALRSLAAFDSPEAAVLAETGEFTASDSAQGVSGSVSEEDCPSGSGKRTRISARSENGDSKVSWFRARKSIDPEADTRYRGIGVRVNGDVSGALLNIRLTNPSHISHGSADYLVRLDFTGERYFMLVEPDGDACAPYTWPPPHRYSYEGWALFTRIDGVELVLHDLPQDRDVSCYVSEVKALPMAESVTKDPSVTIGGQRVTFLTTIKSGDFIELNSEGSCKLYDENGAFTREVEMLGEVPVLRAGANAISFLCEHVEGGEPRYRVVVESTGKPLVAAEPAE